MTIIVATTADTGEQARHYPAEIIEKIHNAIMDCGAFSRASEGDSHDAMQATLAALDALGLTVTEEYSIAYPHRDGWDTDGAECYDTLAEAREELETGNYLDTDRVVSRHKATPWVEVAGE